MQLASRWLNKLNIFRRVQLTENSIIEAKETIEKSISSLSEKISKVPREANTIKSKLEDFIEKTEVSITQINEDIIYLKDRFEEELQKKTTLVRQLGSRMKDFDKIKGLSKKFKDEYNEGLEQLKSDISEFKENDQAVRRLADLEGRIVKMELRLK